MSKEKVIWMDEEIRKHLKNYKTALDDMIESTEKEIDWYSRPGNHEDGRMKKLYDQREQYERERSKITYRLEDRGFSDHVFNELVNPRVNHFVEEVEPDDSMMEQVTYQDNEYIYEQLDEVEKLIEEIEWEHIMADRITDITDVYDYLSRIEMAKDVCKKARKVGEDEGRMRMIDMANRYERQLNGLAHDIGLELNGKV